MKTMILNSSGNVGKSTLTALIATRLQDCKIIEVETVNKGNSEVKGLDVFKFDISDNFEKCYEQIVINENVILDIGASSLGNFMDKLSEFSGIESLFDIFIIPTIQDEKIQTDTYKTIEFLRALEIEDDKIKVVFNRIKTTVKNDFEMLLNAPFEFDENLFIKESSVFKEIGFLRITIDELYNDDNMFYTTLMLKEKDKDQKAVYLKKDIINKMLHKLKPQLDNLFTSIFGLETKRGLSTKKTTTKTIKEPLEIEEEF